MSARAKKVLALARRYGGVGGVAPSSGSCVAAIVFKPFDNREKAARFFEAVVREVCKAARLVQLYDYASGGTLVTVENLLSNLGPCEGDECENEATRDIAGNPLAEPDVRLCDACAEKRGL